MDLYKNSFSYFEFCTNHSQNYNRRSIDHDLDNLKFCAEHARICIEPKIFYNFNYNPLCIISIYFCKK